VARFSSSALDGRGDGVRTRVSLVPVSGRSHQLRVHMAALGCPVVGDDLYGLQLPPAATADGTETGTETADGTLAEGNRAARRLPPRLLLHATSISFAHPTTGAHVSFEAECPF
jgi:23S rRNA-/tRNA-specific pseudouridylate synthase